MAKSDSELSNEAIEFLKTVPKDNEQSPAPSDLERKSENQDERQPDGPAYVSAELEPGTRGGSIGGDGWIKSNIDFLWMVILPLLLIGFYLFAIATPLYEARSVVTISKSSDTNSTGGAGLLGANAQAGSLQDVFHANTFIRSQAMMDLLEDELSLVTELSGRSIDPVQRLRTIPYFAVDPIAQFDRFVTTSVDIQSGQLTIYVRAPSKEAATEISDAILRHAQSHVAQLGQEVFESSLEYSNRLRASNEEQLEAAQASLLALQTSQANTQNDASPAIEGETRTNGELMELEMANLRVQMARDAVQNAFLAQSEASRQAVLNRPLFQVIVPPRTSQYAAFPRVPRTLALTLIFSLACFAGYRMWRN